MLGQVYERSHPKRHKRESITEAEAKEAIRAILKLNEADLKDPNVSTALPYPGLGRPCSTPERNLSYIGRFATRLLLYDFWVKCKSKYLIYGPKGVGKSSDFRAVACVLIQDFTELDSVKNRLVFLPAEVVAMDEVAAVRNALLFTFLVDEVKAYGDWKAARAVIEKIHSMEKAVEFVEERKKMSEKFHFFIDGAEQFDTANFFGRPASVAVNKLLVTGERVWWCTSANDPHRFLGYLPKFRYKQAGFNDMEYAKYASSSFLGELQGRVSSIAELTGFVPLFLEALCVCCEQFAEETFENEHEALINGADKMRLLASTLTAPEPSKEQIVLLLSEDDNWDAVTRKFAHHDELIRVRKRAAGIQLQAQCDTDEAMAELDPTYVMDVKKGIYCSSYIKRIYTEEILSKGEQLRPYADGAWMEYTRKLLQSELDSINWSTLGHLCEDVLGSVIPKKGLILGSLKILGNSITLQRFESIPPRSIESLLKLKTNSGYYFKPQDVNFPDVDAVIVWVDEVGDLHIIPVQYTVNVDGHLKSWQFMNILSLQQWFPDILPYATGTGTGSGKVLLHYAFLGCSQNFSRIQVGNLRTSRLGVTTGTPQYLLHIHPFDDKCIPGLHADDYKLLIEITKRRSWKKSYSHVDPAGAGLVALTRSELEKMAKDHGIADPSSRKKFKDKGVLINEIVKVMQGGDEAITARALSVDCSTNPYGCSQLAMPEHLRYMGTIPAFNLRIKADHPVQ